MKANLFWGALFFSSLVGCGGRDEAKLGTPEEPIVFLLSKDHGSALSTEQINTLQTFLGNETKLTVRVQVAKTDLDAINAFGGKYPKAELGIVNLFGYELAQEEYGAEAALRVLRKDQDPDYTGEIVVQQDSPLKELKDLSGKKIAYIDQYSTSGFILPSVLLATSGVTVESQFAGEPSRAIALLQSGEVDAAAVYEDFPLDASLRVLAKTDSIPNEPIFFRKGFDSAKRAQLVSALQKLSQAPEGKALLPSIAGITGVAPATDADYQKVHEMIEKSGFTAADLIKDGWRFTQPSFDPVP